ncbi:hypothetical protein FNF31_05046 [Cafeteria roenbergensis]|nr:hypothetical protein FNF28_07605 [Cafeteria roenbergensis]KAA0159096.1 hypothetical protein FNF31_05046 [Cafeteria roenbergensis]
MSTVPEGSAMACMQCEQTENGTGCFSVGVCGKDATTAAAQDALVHQLKAIGYWATALREAGKEVPVSASEFTIRSAFSTLTNVNFDADAIANFSKEAEAVRASLQAAAEAAGAKAEDAPATATWSPSAFDKDSVATAGHAVGLEARSAGADADVFAAQEMAVYGLKGAAAYACHALEAGKSSEEVYARLHKVLATLAAGPNASGVDLGSSLGLALEVGAVNVNVMAMLDQGHTEKFGSPVPTPVNHARTAGKAILVSGHDLVDLEALLQQTEGTGVNVYTHGEMLPAHGYPGLKKYSHLVGHYGGPWNLQKFEFRRFPGPILMTTNCIMEPQTAYADRIYTANEVGWPSTQHVTGRDYSKLIEQAKAMEGFPETEPEKTTLTGFGHSAVMSVAGDVLKAIEDGNLKQLVLIGGCDGFEGERSYFTKLAQALPDEAAILTLGCGKFRVLNKTSGSAVIPNTGIPRVLDMGQCNDAYSAVHVATELAGALKCGVNDLPLSLALSWLEQKAVAVLLSLLHLGVKGIRVGPSAPAFVTPNIYKALQDGFDLKVVDADAAEADAAEMMRA